MLTSVHHMSHPSTFKTPEGDARYLAAYDTALNLWPVPYDEIDIPTRFGTSHVVVSGQKDAPRRCCSSASTRSSAIRRPHWLGHVELFPDVQGELVPRSSHDMCFSQHRIVDARVLEFLKKKRADHHAQTEQRSVA